MNNKHFKIYDKFHNQYQIIDNKLDIIYNKGYISYNLLCKLSKEKIDEINIYLDSVDKFNSICLVLCNFRLKHLNIVFLKFNESGEDIVLNEKAMNYIEKLPDNINILYNGLVKNLEKSYVKRKTN